MQISKRSNGELSAIITIEVNPGDYQPRVNKTIKNYVKTASIPGFRQGHVPEGIIRKRIGKEILVEELNRILGEELVNYLRENKIDVLGTPLPVNSLETESFEEGKNFTFDYEIGIAPEFSVKFPSKGTPYYKVIVDDTMVENDMDDLRRRYGKFSNPEVAEEDSVLYGEFSELENGVPKPDGNKTTTTVSIQMIKDDAEKKKFLGMKKDEVVHFNPMKAFGNLTEVSAMLRADKNSPGINADYEFTVKTVNKIEKADINQELFDKVYGEGIVSTEEEFRNKMREGIASYFEKESDKKFQKDVKTLLLETNDIRLPDDFLKRMLKARTEDKKEHDFEHEYFHVAEDLKWDLIQGKLAAENSLKVEQEEIHSTTQMMIVQQFAQYGMAPPDDAKLEEMVQNYLQKDENEERLMRTILGHKVFEHLKKTMKLDISDFSYDEFVEKLKEKSQHEVEHHHH